MAYYGTRMPVLPRYGAYFGAAMMDKRATEVIPPFEGNSTVRSGDWNDSTVWSTGTVPELTERKRITQGHNITVSSDVTFENLLQVNGTIDIQSGATLAIGTFDTKKLGELVLAGGTVSGEGTLGYNWSYIHNDSQDWGTISCHTIKKLPTTSSSFFSSWDIQRIRFLGVNQCYVVNGNQSNSGTPPLFIMQNAVFKDCYRLYLHQSGGQPYHKSIEFNKVSFIDNGIATLGGSSMVRADFKYCYLTGGEFKHGGTLYASQGVHYNNCVVVNAHLWNFGIYSLSNCYFGGNQQTQYVSGLGSGSTNTFTDNVVYCAPTCYNNRAITHPICTGNFCEEAGNHSGSNPFLAEVDPCVWTNNVLIGGSDGYTGLPGSSSEQNPTVNHTMTNNTCVGYNFADYERYTPTAESSIVMKNNLHTGGDGVRPFFMTQNGMAGPTYVTVDYNHTQGNSEWLSDVLVNRVEGLNNVRHTEVDYPQFFDGTRNQARWAVEVAGLPDDAYETVWAYLSTIAGYDTVTGTNSKAPLPEGTITAMHKWIMTGYYVQNQELRTAGEDGALIGANVPTP